MVNRKDIEPDANDETAAGLVIGSLHYPTEEGGADYIETVGKMNMLPPATRKAAQEVASDIRNGRPPKPRPANAIAIGGGLALAAMAAGVLGDQASTAALSPQVGNSIFREIPQAPNNSRVTLAGRPVTLTSGPTPQNPSSFSPPTTNGQKR